MNFIKPLAIIQNTGFNSLSLTVILILLIAIVFTIISMRGKA